MVTPPQTVTLAPSQTLSPSVMGAEVWMPSERWEGCTACPAQASTHPGAMKVPAPTWMGEVSRNAQL